MRSARPDFLVISPPRTASTWLHTFLTRHPDVFVPSKEVSFFGGQEKWQTVAWYRSLFIEGDGKCRGEVSGLYSLLPTNKIREISILFPGVKVIILVRNPMERLWSHVRHDFTYRVGPFWKMHHLSEIPLELLFEEDWLDYYICFGDYGLILRNWLSIISNDKIFVGFIEGLNESQYSILNKLCLFLNIGPADKAVNFDPSKKVNSQSQWPVPTVLMEKCADDIYDSLQRLNAILLHKFGMSAPRGWMRETVRNRPSRTAHTHSRSGDHIAKIKKAWLPRFVESTHRGFNILYYGGNFHCVAWNSGITDVHKCSVRALNVLEKRGKYAVFSKIDDARNWLPDRR